MLTRYRARSKRVNATLIDNLLIFKQPTCVLPLSVRGIARVSKFGALFPNFRGLSLAAIAAADLTTLIPTIATMGGQLNNAFSDSLTKWLSGNRHICRGPKLNLKNIV